MESAVGLLGRFVPKTRMGRRLVLLLLGLSMVLLVAVLLTALGHSECTPVDDDIRRSANPVEVLPPEQWADPCGPLAPLPAAVRPESAWGA